MAVTTAPPGRVYSIPPKADLAAHLAACQSSYRGAERREPRWARVHSTRFDAFAGLWPGHVVADDRIVRATLMLGWEE